MGRICYVAFDSRVFDFRLRECVYNFFCVVCFELEVLPSFL